MQKILFVAASCLALFVVLFPAFSSQGDGGEAYDPATQPPLHQVLSEFQEDLKMFARQEPVGQTWVEINGEIFGAKPDQRGPIGGAKGYSKIVTDGDYRPKTLDELLDSLQKAKPGQVVFLGEGLEIDCTERVHIEKLVLEIPAGVTLASNRGQGDSRGALIYSDVFNTKPLIRAAGQHVRVTGLRLRGPDPKRRLQHHHRSFAQGRGHDYYYKFPISRGITTEHAGLEVDNCELAGWSHAAIFLQAGNKHHIHHNFIHHNQYNGLGYGVCHDIAFSLIEQNLFNYNRHSIAGTGRPGSGYEARNNVEIKHSLSHCFDMHGGADRNDGTKIAGTQLSIHHNTFWSPVRAIAIRGVPEKNADIHHNWFYHDGSTIAKAVRASKKVTIRDNVFGFQNPKLHK